MFYRKKSNKIAENHNAETIIVWVKTPLETSMKREKERRTDPDYLPIPNEIYRRLAKNLTPPTDTEKVIEIDGTISSTMQFKSFENQLKNFS